MTLWQRDLNVHKQRSYNLKTDKSNLQRPLDVDIMTLDMSAIWRTSNVGFSWTHGSFSTAFPQNCK